MKYLKKDFMNNFRKFTTVQCKYVERPMRKICRLRLHEKS